MSPYVVGQRVEVRYPDEKSELWWEGWRPATVTKIPRGMQHSAAAEVVFDVALPQHNGGKKWLPSAANIRPLGQLAPIEGQPGLFRDPTDPDTIVSLRKHEEPQTTVTISTGPRTVIGAPRPDGQEVWARDGIHTRRGRIDGARYVHKDGSASYLVKFSGERAPISFAEKNLRTVGEEHHAPRTRPGSATPPATHNATCGLCGAPAYTGLLGTTCLREDRTLCWTPDEQAAWQPESIERDALTTLLGQVETGWRVIGAGVHSLHPLREEAIAGWRRAVAQTRMKRRSR
jgi:hypothetical protein